MSLSTNVHTAEAGTSPRAAHGQVALDLYDAQEDL